MNPRLKGHDTEMNESKTVPIKDDVDFARLSEFMREMEAMYPDIRVFSVGESIRGREILAARLGNPMAPTSTLYVGAHHGMEHITSAVLMRFINEYFQYRAEGRRMFGVGMDFIFERRAIYVVPMLNPDGVELSLHGADEKSPLYERLLKMNGSDDFTHWQANERGVDLNHNYNAGFVEYKRIEKDSGIFGGCASGYSGEYPESEPEVSALCGLIRTLEPNVILTLHTQGEEIYCGGDYASKKTLGVGHLIAEMTGYTLAVPTGSAAYGGLTDWFVREYGKPSFTLECGRGENPLPHSDFPKISAGLRELLFSLPMLI